MLPVEKGKNLKARLVRDQKRLSDSFDSPVIYGVRVETSNPYHLLISNAYICALRTAENRLSEMLVCYQ